MPRRGPGRLHGYLVIDKPAGWTSHDVVGRIRRLTGERKVGHAGTLDPAATGVLPVAVGLATRSLEFLVGCSKTYLAEITFGVRTDSFDVDGTVTEVSPIGLLNGDTVESALEGFKGLQFQIPPMHSAIKIDGRRLYELARRGEEIERSPREITIHVIELVSWQPPVATVRIDCSTGTYIRSIAHDLGERLGCGAYLSNLVRLRAGSFTLHDSWTLHGLAEMDLEAEWPSIAIHPDAALEHTGGIIVDATSAAAWAYGKPLPADNRHDGWVRIYDEAGTWLGIAEGVRDSNEWRPHKVITDAA